MIWSVCLSARGEFISHYLSVSADTGSWARRLGLSTVGVGTRVSSLHRSPPPRGCVYELAVVSGLSVTASLEAAHGSQEAQGTRSPAGCGWVTTRMCPLLSAWLPGDRRGSGFLWRGALPGFRVQAWSPRGVAPVCALAAAPPHRPGPLSASWPPPSSRGTGTFTSRNAHSPLPPPQHLWDDTQASCAPLQDACSVQGWALSGGSGLGGGSSGDALSILKAGGTGQLDWLTWGPYLSIAMGTTG